MRVVLYRFLLNPSGRLCGEAFVQFEGVLDVQRALALNGRQMHSCERYIEGKPYLQLYDSGVDLVFEVTDRDISARLPPTLEQSCCVRIRGLPYDITKESIKEFFAG
jgi:hypothetical protein